MSTPDYIEVMIYLTEFKFNYVKFKQKYLTQSKH